MDEDAGRADLALREAALTLLGFCDAERRDMPFDQCSADSNFRGQEEFAGAKE